MNNENSTLSLSIMSGKGGVGKTNIVLNLGYALREAGHSSMLMDCDLGLANLDVLLGISPERNLQDLLQTDLSPSEVAVSIEEAGHPPGHQRRSRAGGDGRRHAGHPVQETRHAGRSI